MVRIPFSLSRCSAPAGILVWLALLFLVLSTGFCTSGEKPIRLALMDFTVEENSYRLAQEAKNFTIRLQVELNDLPGFEWVERAQLDLAKKELGLSDMDLLGGDYGVRRGKWAKADWLVTGQFALDDRSRRTLFLEITDLNHADVLASETILLTDQPPGLAGANQSEVKFVATALRRLFAAARERAVQNQDRQVIAALFFVNASPFHYPTDISRLSSTFYDTLDSLAATNSRLRVLRFPEAYRAMNEAGMVLDGYVESDPNSWNRLANAYVWGIYSSTNSRVAGKTIYKSTLEFHIWDGISRPRVISEEITNPPSGLEPAGPFTNVYSRLVQELSAPVPGRARKTPRDDVRQELARSIVRRLAGPTGEAPRMTPGDRQALIEVVREIEAACFLDPDNADAQIMRLTSRWGWWMDFGFDVKNQFWSQWRRSRAWGEYVDRFGFASPGVKLPFPYVRQDLSQPYVESARELARLCPTRADTDEEAQNPNYLTPARSARLHGFPKDVPADVVLEWKAGLEKELHEREKKVAAYQTSLAMNSPSTSTNRIRPPSIPPRPPGAAYGSSSTAQPSLSSSPSSWLKGPGSVHNYFGLSLPGLLPEVVHPNVVEAGFPGHFEVQSIKRILRWQDRLLVLAQDHRPGGVSDPNPDVTSEVQVEPGRLWVLDAGRTNPVLLEATGLPETIYDFCLDENQLWLAGPGLARLDLRSLRCESFAPAQGPDRPQYHCVAARNGCVYTANNFLVSVMEVADRKWTTLPRPSDSLSGGTGSQWMVAANDTALCFVAGHPCIYNFKKAAWADVMNLNPHCMIVEPGGFRFGTREGLAFYDTAHESFTRWETPSGIKPPLLNAAVAITQQMGSGIPSDMTKQMMVSAFRGVALERLRRHQARRDGQDLPDPLHYDTRTPGDITALARDGDYLWLGSGSWLYALHLPNASLVACAQFERGAISCLAVDGDAIWVGTSWGDHLLRKINRRDLLSVPRQKWPPIAVTPAERRRVIESTSARDQAMYSFYTSDDRRAVELLRNVDPAKATLEEMLLLMLANDTVGVNNPEAQRAWAGRIMERYPDSPWSQIAQSAMSENEEKRREAQIVAKFDLNRDGVLDDSEKWAMQKDPVFRREEEAAADKLLESQLKALLERYDRNQNGRLDAEEWERIRSNILLYAELPPERLAGHKTPLQPFLTKKFPTVEALLKKYDLNHDGGLDVNELRALARDLRP